MPGIVPEVQEIAEWLKWVQSLLTWGKDKGEGGTPVAED